MRKCARNLGARQSIIWMNSMGFGCLITFLAQTFAKFMELEVHHEMKETAFYFSPPTISDLMLNLLSDAVPENASIAFISDASKYN